jgi:uncharacterized protein
MRCLHAALVVIAAMSLAGCASTLRARIFLPTPMPAATAWEGPAPQDVSARESKGMELRGYYWPPSSPGGDVIVYFHGQSGNRLVAAQAAAPLARHGGLLVASYRGYGDNPGEPKEAAVYEDALAFVALARKLAPGSRIYLLGYSLGAAPALHAAAKVQVAGVILLGAFTDLAAVAPWYAGPLLPDAFDNRRTIQDVDEPILILHGTADAVVPIAHAIALRAASPRGARLLRLEGAGHGADYQTLAPVIWENLRQMPR